MSIRCKFPIVIVLLIIIKETARFIVWNPIRFYWRNKSHSKARVKQNILDKFVYFFLSKTGSILNNNIYQDMFSIIGFLLKTFILKPKYRKLVITQK